MLSTTILLLVCGSLSILLLEWHNTLTPLDPLNRLLSAFFQSVSARTAGFNTLQIETLVNQTLFLIILLMFVGAFGTVGLSAGVTPGLSPLGRLIITAVMFIGRLGHPV